ncbi:hypothetical protein BS78_09G255900 [Paspalum vaginatum]|nr:hypothetical protein BS78_09G255900 [Paspalum vaginatum]
MGGAASASRAPLAGHRPGGGGGGALHPLPSSSPSLMSRRPRCHSRHLAPASELTPSLPSPATDPPHAHAPTVVGSARRRTFSPRAGACTAASWGRAHGSAPPQEEAGMLRQSSSRHAVCAFASRRSASRPCPRCRRLRPSPARLGPRRSLHYCLLGTGAQGRATAGGGGGAEAQP